MNIEDKGYGSFIITSTENEALGDIAVAIIMASYELALPFGCGLMRAYQTEMTKEMAKDMLNGKDVSHDYPCNKNKPKYVYWVCRM